MKTSGFDFERRLLAAGIVASSASALRFVGGAVGLGELLIAGWLVAVLLVMPSLRSIAPAAHGSTPAIRAFWISAVVAMTLGASARLMWGPPALNSSRDVFAYLFVGLFAVTLASRHGHDEVAHISASVVRLMTLFVGAQVLVAAAVGGPSLWWFGPRFRGFAQDPNQLGFYLAALPFMAVWLTRRRDQAHSRSRAALSRPWMAVALAVCAGGMVMTQSDSLALAWTAGLLAMYARHYVTLLGRPVTGYWSGVLQIFIIPAAVVAVAVSLSGPIIGSTVTGVQSLAGKDNQASTRLALWESAMQATSESPVFGWGPGSYSGLYGPYEGFEAHNSYLQLATNAGIIGLGALAILLLGLLASAWRSGSPPLVGGVAALMVLMVFHHALRHPVLWFDIWALYAMAQCSLGSSMGAASYERKD